MDDDIDRAARAIREGKLVVYPTETVYGLAADALDSQSVERVFAAKGRDRSNPVSLGVPDVERALEYVDAGERERRFMREFLPGPVTIVCAKEPSVPDELTGGRDRVGVRVPDHDLARRLSERAGPITATSANVSGGGSARTVEGIDPALRDRAAVVLDEGETPGTESTVVDVAAGEIHRPGAEADEIRAWLDGDGE